MRIPQHTCKKLWQDLPRKNFSHGRTHSAFCKNGWAARQSKAAQEEICLQADQAQNVVNTVFGSCGRGMNDAKSRNVHPGCEHSDSPFDNF